MPELTSDIADRSRVFSQLCGILNAAPGSNPGIELNETTAIADLAMDSLKLVEVIYELECYFNCDADEGLMAEVRTLGDVVSLFCGAPEESGSSEQ